MKKKIVMRVDLPEEYAPGKYYEYVSDDLTDCIDQLAYLNHEVEERGLSLEGYLFTITGRKETFVFNPYFMEDWIKHGGTEHFLDRCRMPGDLVQRVEDALASMGYEFKREPKGVCSSDEDELFTCECPYPISCYGLKFNGELYVHIYAHADGSQSIEYGVSETCALAMSEEDTVKAIMEKSNLGKTEAEKAWSSIVDLAEANSDAMIKAFGPIFEERFPDVYIIDRLYTSNFLRSA